MGPRSAGFGERPHGQGPPGAGIRGVLRETDPGEPPLARIGAEAVAGAMPSRQSGSHHRPRVVNPVPSRGRRNEGGSPWRSRRVEEPLDVRHGFHLQIATGLLLVTKLQAPETGRERTWSSSQSNKAA